MKVYLILILFFASLFAYSQIDSVVTIKDSVKVMSKASKYTDVYKLSRNLEKAIVVGYENGFYKLKFDNDSIGWVEGFSVKEHSYDLTQYGSYYPSSYQRNISNQSITPSKKISTQSNDCPTTSSCGCSNKNKADCNSPCCSWVVGKGCGCK